MSAPNLSGYTVEEPKTSIGFTSKQQTLIVVRQINYGGKA